MGLVVTQPDRWMHDCDTNNIVVEITIVYFVGKLVAPHYHVICTITTLFQCHNTKPHLNTLLLDIEQEKYYHVVTQVVTDSLNCQQAECEVDYS